MTLRRIWRLVGILLALIVLGSGVLPVMAQDATPADQCLNKGGFYDETLATCNALTNFRIEVAYPVELLPNDAIEGALDQYIAQQTSDLLALASTPGFPFGPDGVNYSLNINYDIYHHSASVLSLQLTTSTYTGGAHPISFFQTYVFNLDQGRVIPFNEIFPPENDPLATIAPIARAQLHAQWGDDAEGMWIEAGTAMDSANYQDFVLTEDSVIFFFEPYQVGPYAMGPQSVTIPMAELASVMAPLS
mgnify:CR=1 FL=1